MKSTPTVPQRRRLRVPLDEIAFRAFGDQGETGVTEIRLFATLIPNSSPISSTVGTSASSNRADLVAGFLRDHGDRVAAAIEQVETERDRAHVEMLHLGHRDGLKNFGLCVFHRLPDHFAEDHEHNEEQQEQYGSDEQETQDSDRTLPDR